MGSGCSGELTIDGEANTRENPSPTPRPTDAAGVDGQDASACRNACCEIDDCTPDPDPDPDPNPNPDPNPDPDPAVRDAAVDPGPCVPATCASFGGACGNLDDGCGGTLDCGRCELDELFEPDRITDWNPGILADSQLGMPLDERGLPLRTTLCATLAPGDNIAGAIDACPEGQVVQLGPGTFTVSNTLTLDKGVVLRGSGSQAAGGTTIELQGGGPVLAIGHARDSTCYGGTGRPLVADAPKGSTILSIGAAAADFAAGDLALIDIADQDPVDQGDCSYFKRENGRSLSQRVEVVAVDEASGTLTLGSPLHWTFRAGGAHRAEVVPVNATVRWAGIEHLRLRGGRNTGYNGQMAGGIDISNAAYSWVRDVQTDESIGGMHIALTGTYRVVIRDGYHHHSANYGFGADCYGIVLRCGAADNLVENNIVRYMNKPILFNVSGGGNVVAYNYTDNSWSTPPEWQEVNIDCHCSFPHMELIEGNYAPHMGATTTHGNAGYLTFFRNYASGQFAEPAVVGSSATQTGNIGAIQFQGRDVGMNVVGNVLGTAGWTTAYETYSSSVAAVYQLSGSERGGVPVTSMFRHGNYDYANEAVQWSPDVATRALPPSLYRNGRPGWWPSQTPWPFAGPDLSPMVGELPAKTRADTLR